MSRFDTIALVVTLFLLAPVYYLAYCYMRWESWDFWRRHNRQYKLARRERDW